jgi:hypothetical protein
MCACAYVCVCVCVCVCACVVWLFVVPPVALMPRRSSASSHQRPSDGRSVKLQGHVSGAGAIESSPLVPVPVSNGRLPPSGCTPPCAACMAVAWGACAGMDGAAAAENPATAPAPLLPTAARCVGGVPPCRLSSASATSTHASRRDAADTGRMAGRTPSSVAVQPDSTDEPALACVCVCVCV